MLINKKKVLPLVKQIFLKVVKQLKIQRKDKFCIEYNTYSTLKNRIYNFQSNFSFSTEMKIIKNLV